MSGKDIFVALPNGWTTTKCFLCRYLKGVHNGIVLALSLLMHMKDLVEEQTVNISFAWHGHCSTAPTNYPKVTQYVIQMLHNWLYSGGRAVVYSVDKTLSSLCRSGLSHETKSHSLCKNENGLDTQAELQAVASLSKIMCMYSTIKLCPNKSWKGCGTTRRASAMIQYPQGSWTESEL